MIHQFFIQKRTGLLKYRDFFLTKLSKIYKLIPKQSLFQEDWKNCIILDACRYDFFKKANWIKGNLNKHYSVATHTIPFCHKTFTKENYKDIVCISANPHVDREIGEKFYDVIPVWKNKEFIKNGTTLPQAFIEPTRLATIKYPNKRFLLWFVQPHSPYISMKYPEIRGMLYGMQSKRFLEQFQLYFWAHLPKDKLYGLYMNNLIRALVVCEKLIKIFNGKTVITSDHGECLGERIPLTPIKIWGHYQDITSLKMYEIPYLIIN